MDPQGVAKVSKVVGVVRVVRVVRPTGAFEPQVSLALVEVFIEVFGFAH